MTGYHEVKHIMTGILENDVLTMPFFPSFALLFFSLHHSVLLLVYTPPLVRLSVGEQISRARAHN